MLLFRNLPWLKDPVELTLKLADLIDRINRVETFHAAPVALVVGFAW